MVKRAVLGIDIGGTKTLCALIDEDFRFVHEIKFQTAPAEGKEAFVRHLTGAARALSQRAKRAKLNVVGAGAAIAGRVDFTKRSVEESPNILFLEGHAIGRTLQKAAHLECVVGNDVQ